MPRVLARPRASLWRVCVARVGVAPVGVATTAAAPTPPRPPTGPGQRAAVCWTKQAAVQTSCGQVSCDWRRAGHVISILISHWSRRRRVQLCGVSAGLLSGRCDRQVSRDWWRAGHVTTILTSDWSGGRQVEPGGGRLRVPAHHLRLLPGPVHAGHGWGHVNPASRGGP